MSDTVLISLINFRNGLIGEVQGIMHLVYVGSFLIDTD